MGWRLLLLGDLGLPSLPTPIIVFHLNPPHPGKCRTVSHPAKVNRYSGPGCDLRLSSGTALLSLCQCQQLETFLVELLTWGLVMGDCVLEYAEKRKKCFPRELVEQNNF